jgi:aminoacylase
MAAPPPAAAGAGAGAPALSPADAAAVDAFREYLRARTVHPDPVPGYAVAEGLFRRLAEGAGLAFERHEFAPGHPTLVLTWRGTRPDLPSVVLSSHMDVVPVDDARWTVPPWDGALQDGRIYGRGAQDMKSVTVQYLAAIARLRAAGFTPTRTLHVLIVPDEEVGGNRGMKLLLTSAVVRAMNPAFVLDEGLASPSDKYTVFYGERKIWWATVTATGAAGHGSRFVDGTAVPKLCRVIDAMLAHREAQKAELDRTCGCGKQLGDFTTINCTMLSAGNPDPATPQFNVIPTTATAGFDIRIPATVDLREFKAQMDAWTSVDEGVTWKVIAGMTDGMLENPVSPTGPDSFWWGAFTRGLAAAGADTHEPSIFPAATDSRWVRLMLGVPCFGFSPIRRTPILLHDHDEFVPVDVFVEGIGVYEKLIPHLTEAPEPGAAPA